MTTRLHFVSVRALLGLYLCFHFYTLWPYAPELFSSAGMLAERTHSPLLHAFPNLLALYDAPWFTQSLVALAAICSLTLALGHWPRASALVVYAVWACAFGRNPLIDNPSLAYIGLILLVCAAVADDPLTELTRARRPYTVLWLAMAVGYTYSGLTKLASPSWLDGSALRYVLDNPLARPSQLRDMLLALPASWLHAATLVALALELSFAPLALFARLRPWLWGALLTMHLSLLALVQFADLSLGMVVLHAFTFNPRWLAARSVIARWRVAPRPTPLARRAT